MLRLTDAGAKSDAVPPWLQPLLDGTRDLEALLRDARQLTPPHGPLEVVGRMSQLQQAGLVLGWQDAAATRRRHNLRLHLKGLDRALAAGRLLSRGAMLRWGRVSMAALLVVLVGLAATGRLSAVLAPFSAHEAPLAMWARTWLLAAGLATLRAVARGLTLVAAGRPAPGVFLTVRHGLVVLDTEDLSGRALSPPERADLARAGLASLSLTFVASCLAFVLTGQLLARDIAAMALLACVLDLAPYLATDGGDLVGLAARVPDLGRRSRSWLLRRVVRNLRAGPVGPLERAYLWVTSAWLAHAILAIAVLLFGLLPPALELAVRSAARADWLLGALPALAVLSLAGILVAGIVLVAAGFCVQLFHDRHSDGPAEAGALPESDAADFARAAAAIPFLARLGSGALRDLARSAQREQYPPGSLILRQGDPGDRFCFLASGQAIVRIEEESGLRHEVVRLGPGDFFGETALIEAVPRTASVLSTSTVVLYTLSRDQFLSALAAAGADGAEVREQIRNAAVLRSNPLFQGLGKDGLRRLLERVEVYRCDRPEVILRQGDAGDAMYVIRQGGCTVTRRDDGVDRVVAQILPGDWFGEIALLGSQERTATVRAEAGTVLIEVPREAVDEVLLEDISAATTLAAIAAERFAGLSLGSRP